MLTFLIAVLMAPQAVLWRFPGPNADALRTAAAQVQSAGTLADHLVTDDALDAHLSTVQLPENLGCFADQETCEDPRQATLNILNLRARIDAVGNRTEHGYVATLELSPADGGEPQTFTGAGGTFAEAVRDATDSMGDQAGGSVEMPADGQSLLMITIEPIAGQIYVDDVLIGEGSGRYPVAPGAHQVRIEAEGYMALEQPVDVEEGEHIELRFTLGNDQGELQLRLSPPEAQATLDGEFFDPQEASALPPGTYTLRVTAPGYAAHEEDVIIKAGSQVTLTVGLGQRGENPFDRFREPHPDTQAHAWYTRADVRFVSVSDGPLNVTRGSGDDKIEYTRQDETMGLLGLTVGLGWQSRYLRIEALSLSFEGAGGATKVIREDGLEDGIDRLSRYTVRPAWVGLRYPRWRLEPYIQGGLEYAYETFESESGAALSKSSLLLGIEAGLHAQLSPEWFGTFAGIVDFGPENRTVGALILGAGYTFDWEL